MTAMCSALSIAEPLAGTAPTATAWLIIEQPGPWGRQALTDSRLDPHLGRFLAGLSREHGVRTLLTRHPDRPERAGHGSRNVWIASANESVLRRIALDDLDALRAWDFAAIAAGSPVGEVERLPLLLVCTHGRRDACCAVHGRGLLTALHEAATPLQRNRIWECSHVGGHRFAPTTLTLPDGVVHGRVSPADAARLLHGAMHGRVLPERLRGCTYLSPPLQAATAHVHGLVDDDAAGLRVRASSAGNVIVEAPDGRSWRVEVVQEPLAGPRPESCGAEAVLGSTWRVLDCVLLG